MVPCSGMQIPASQALGNQTRPRGSSARHAIPPWAYARRVTGSPVHQRGVSGPSKRLASAGRKFLVFRNLYLAWGSHWARQGLRPWYPPECVQARFVTTPRSAGICSLSGRSKGIAWETRMQRFAVIGRQLQRSLSRHTALEVGSCRHGLIDSARGAGGQREKRV